jgi:hypothetical protein
VRKLAALRLSPSMLVASAALMIALGGTSYAVATGSVDSRAIKDDAIKSKDVMDDSLAKKDLRKSLRKAVGATGVADLKVVETGPQNGTAVAPCPTGRHAISGGAETVPDSNHLVQSIPQIFGGNGWVVSAATETGAPAPVVALAICVPD